MPEMEMQTAAHKEAIITIVMMYVEGAITKDDMTDAIIHTLLALGYVVAE